MCQKPSKARCIFNTSTLCINSVSEYLIISRSLMQYPRYSLPTLAKPVNGRAGIQTQKIWLQNHCSLFYWIASQVHYIFVE